MLSSCRSSCVLRRRRGRLSMLNGDGDVCFEDGEGGEMRGGGTYMFELYE